MTKRFR